MRININILALGKGLLQHVVGIDAMKRERSQIVARLAVGNDIPGTEMLKNTKRFDVAKSRLSVFPGDMLDVDNVLVFTSLLEIKELRTTQLYAAARLKAYRTNKIRQICANLLRQPLLDLFDRGLEDGLKCGT